VTGTRDDIVDVIFGALDKTRERGAQIWIMHHGIRRDGTFSETMSLADAARTLGISRTTAQFAYHAADAAVKGALAHHFIRAANNGVSYEEVMQETPDGIPRDVAANEVSDRYGEHLRMAGHRRRTPGRPGVKGTNGTQRWFGG
jgi:hypothetical protein